VAPATATAAASLAATPSLECEGESLTFMLSFLANIQHAGFLIAEQKGYYDELGLSVEIQSAGPGIDVASAVADGTANLGQVDYVPLVDARNSDVPIKAVAQIYKDPFFFWYSAKDGGPATVAEWEGMRVGAIQVGEYPERDAMMIEAGIDPDAIESVSQDFDAVLDPAAMDIAEGVVFFHPALINAGVIPGTGTFPDDYNVFRPQELGADFASQTIAGNEQFLAEHPSAVACFIAGSIRGWQEAFMDPESAVDNTMAFVPEDSPITPEHQRAALPDVLAIVGEDECDTTLLEPDPESYQSTVDQLVDVGFFEESEAPDIADTYDASFWEVAKFEGCPPDRTPRPQPTDEETAEPTDEESPEPEPTDEASAAPSATP
jgi:NitT/TauT family transport system substrate-binding protein